MVSVITGIKNPIIENNLDFLLKSLKVKNPKIIPIAEKIISVIKTPFPKPTKEKIPPP
jgi:transcriptional antiterminator